MDQRDQFRLACHRLRQDRIACPHAVRLMCVASSRRDLAVLLRQLFGSRIRFCRLATVERLDKIKPLRDLRREIEPSRVGKTHILLPARMSRTEHAAVSVHQIYEKCKRHSPHFKETHFHSLRHDYDDMSRISCIIFNSFEHHKVRMFLPLDMLFPVAVSVISVMIRNDHSLKSVLL